MLKTLSIEQYKGFYQTQTVVFAIPDGTKNGSGLTLIVGPNNTGKTTIIESLLITTEKKFKESERHSSISPVIKITNHSGTTSEFTNVVNGSVIQNVGQPHDIKFELLPSRRFWAHEFRGATDFPSFVSDSSGPDVRKLDSFNLGPLLRTILLDADARGRFDEILKRLMPHFTSWTIDTNDAGADYIKYKTQQTYHQSNMLGDGVISLFRIAAHLVHDQVSTFIIDEPELSLHPTAQKRLAQLLSELSKHKQVIVCTHSPYFANWEDFTNGSKVIRLNKHKDVQCTVSSLDNTKDYGSFIATSTAEYQRPQLIDTTAKEILFSDRILFVEGQEDVGLFRRWSRDNGVQLNFEIFGYGVGGEQNMKLFLELAQDLNIERVGALYDQNSTSFPADELNYPSYKLLRHTAEDIRDKKDPSGVITRSGLFTSDGVIKPASQAEFSSLVNTYINYFSA
ncbi:MAG: AAA family ATPase [Pyrinomonadaceae bacterium]